MPLFPISTQILLRNVNTPAFKAWVSLTNYLSLTAETSVQQTNAHLEHLDSEFRTAGLGVNAVRIAEHRQRSEVGCIALLCWAGELQQRTYLQSEWTESSPDSKIEEPTRQGKGGMKGVHVDSETLAKLKSQRTHSY